MKLIVTGGAGFIGSCFIRYILSKYNDYKVINLDALTYAGNIDNLIDVKDNLESFDNEKAFSYFDSYWNK